MWVLKDSTKFPWNRSEIELPNPQPGQCSNPAFESGHIVKWVSNGFTKKAK